MEKLVRGWGVNDGGYRTSIKTDYYVSGKRKYKTLWKCPVYAKWISMLERCHSEKWKKNKPTYRDVSVVEEWKYFSNFKSWMDKQNVVGDLELDKDILVPGNKVYGPETCCLVPRYLNLAITLGSTSVSLLPVGVSLPSRYLRKDGSETPKKYVCRINDSEGKTRKLGTYRTAMDAHKVWQDNKIAFLEDVLNKYSKDVNFNTRVADAFMSKIWKLRLDSALGLETKSI